jgi:fumarylpyruvate hydrolase
MTSALHHEAELVIAIGKEGLRITPENALSHVFGYAIGCDLTRRDLQSKAKKLAQPWAAAKGFDYSAPCGPIVPADEVQLSANAAISLSINGRMRQDSTINKMIWSIPEIISILSKYFKLKPGDLIFTGTPEGVAEIVKGDVVRVECSNLPPCVFEVGEEE